MLDDPAQEVRGASPRSTQALPPDLVETDTPEISVPELLIRVQEEVARLSKLSSTNPYCSESGPVSYLGTGRRSRSSLDWGLITAKLHIAEKNAAVGQSVPKLRRVPGTIRPLARFIAAVLLYPLRMITNPQREFNVAMLTALQALKDGVRQMEKAHQQSLAKLEEGQDRSLNLLKEDPRRKAG